VLEALWVKRHVVLGANDFALDLLPKRRLLLRVNRLDARSVLFGLPRRRPPALDVPHFENAAPALVAHVGEL